MHRVVGHLVVVLLPLAFGILGENVAASASQVFAPGARAKTWELLADLAANASSDQAPVTAEELATEWTLDALRAIPLYQSKSRHEKRAVTRGIAELQLLGGAPAHSFERLEAFLDYSAASEGDPTAQFLLGALAEQGHQARGNDPVKTVLFYEFASRGGSLPATMALGYRYLHGYNVPRSCDAAMQYYRHAADRVMTEGTSRGGVLPTQMYSLPEPVRLSDNHHHADRRTHPQRDQEDLGRAEYLRHRALASRTPELLERSASIALFSDLYCSPPSSWLLSDEEDTCTIRGREAVEFLHEAAESGSFSARALLGHVYAFSLAGVERNVSRAIDLYQEALDLSRAAGTIAAEAANGLGLVYSNGLEGSDTPDPQEAMSLFKMAADAGLADGVYNMAVMMSDAYPAHAQDYFAAAAEVGHLNSVYELARLKNRESSAAPGASGACSEAVALYKQVAEHSAELRRVLDLALARFNAGAWDSALVLYRIAAEMGSEVAQSNAAWIIERKWTWSTVSGSVKGPSRDYLALVQRAAEQNSPDAFIRLGDWEFARGNHAAALAHYSEADELSNGASGRALFSIGYMHEHGLGGVVQSYERAGLYYLFAGDTERVMWYPMAMLRFKTQVQSVGARLLSIVNRTWSAATALWRNPTDLANVEDLEVSIDDHQQSKVSDTLAVNTNEGHTSSQHAEPVVAVMNAPTASVEFAAALQFDGESSQLDVELAAPILGVEFQDFTIESWVFIDAPLELDAQAMSAEDSRRPMMLVDALNNFQVELVPDHHDVRVWQLCFRKFSLTRTDHPEATALFVNAPLESERWHHIALAFDARTQTVSLFVGGQARGHYSLQPRRFVELSAAPVAVDRSAASRLVAVGSSLSRHVHPANSASFYGQLARFRVWRSCLPVDRIQRFAVAEDPGATASVRDQLAIDLRCHVYGSLADGDAHVLNGDRLVPSARGVRLRMVRFPPTLARTGPSSSGQGSS